MVLQVNHRHAQGASEQISASITSHARQRTAHTPFEELPSKVTDFKATRENPQSSVLPASKLL